VNGLLENAKRLSLAKLSKNLPKYKRFLFGKIAESSSQIVGLYGARGAGKTTLLLQVAKELKFKPSEILYISCEHPAFKDISLFEFVRYFEERGGKLVIVDEIHELREFERELKTVYDFLNIRVFFSGSSAIKLTSPDLARRYSMFRLPQMSLREYIEIEGHLSLRSYGFEDMLSSHEDITSEIVSALGDAKILKYFGEFLKVGAYPYYFEDKRDYLQKLNDTINLIIKGDLASIFMVPPDKIDILKKLLITICRSAPLEISIDKLATTVGITKVTLYKYLEYLQKGELLRLVMHEMKRYKDVRRSDKLYLYSTNLFNALCIESDIGTIRESFFASMVGYEHTIHYQEECDFLVDEKYSIEVGGQSKSFTQLNGVNDGYLVVDDIEFGSGKKIPLWLFGFLY